MPPANFSLRAVVTTALISFVVSGVGGAAVSDWYARAKPSVAIGLVGFSGSREMVPASDRLVSLTKSSGWIRTYRKFESFDSMTSDFENADRVRKRLERGLVAVEDWLAGHEARFDTDNAILTTDEVSDVPFVIDNIFPSTLIGMARRGELDSVPRPVSDFSAGSRVWDLADTGRAWVLYLGTKNVLFPYEDLETATERAAVKLLAHSFSYGVGKNIVYYMKMFRDDANAEIRKLISVKEELTEVLLPQTRLSVRGTVFNEGGRPVVIKPFAAIQVLNDDIEQKSFVVRVEPPKDAVQSPDPDLLSTLRAGIRKRKSGEDVATESFLPESDGSTYVLVPPHSGVEIKLTSVDELGETGARLRAIYDANVLRCQLRLLTVDGDAIQSEALLFGSSADANLLAELQDLQ